jgi:hypothetical protein
MRIRFVTVTVQVPQTGCAAASSSYFMETLHYLQIGISAVAAGDHIVMTLAGQVAFEKDGSTSSA